MLGISLAAYVQTNMVETLAEEKKKPFDATAANPLSFMKLLPVALSDMGHTSPFYLRLEHNSSAGVRGAAV